MAFSEATDELLLREAAAGRFASFEELGRRHQQRLLGFLWRATGSRPLAESLFVETWREAYRLRGSQAAAQGFSTALFSIACRLAAKALAADPGLGAPSGGLPPFEPGSLEYRAARLGDSLLSVPLKARMALLLCFFDSFHFSQAAVCLAENEDALRRLAAEGLGRLRAALGDDFLREGLR